MLLLFNVLIFLCGLSYAAGADSQRAQLPTRVVLARDVTAKKHLLPFLSAQGFHIANVRKPSKNHTVHTQHLAISVAPKGMIALNGTNTQAKQLSIVPYSGSFSYADQPYYGSLVVKSDGTKLTITHYADRAAAKQANAQKMYEHLQTTRTSSNADKKKGLFAQARHPYNVRVLLDERSAFSHSSLHISAPAGFAVVDPDDDTSEIRYTDPDVTIKEKDGHMFIAGVRYPAHKKIYLVPVKGHITFNGKPYQGAFLVTRYKDRLLLVNSIEIEDYVYSVLKSEGWPGWPLEVYKAFAIASRSYVIAMVFRAKTTKLPYHIRNTNVHQTYAGHHVTPVLKQAVDQTKGMFLAYNGQPIIAMFDICCGGVIPAKISGFNFKEAPYLARTYKCSFCKDCSSYSWSVHYTLDELSHLCRHDFPHLRKLKTVKVAGKDKAGLVRQVTLQGHKKATVTGKKMRSMCKKIKSLCFSIYRYDDDFYIEGHGYGHHLGICQWGAREMVRQGYDYKEVLQFYYPKTNFMRLS